jgi:very-short-patch-repair endonuclease
MEKPKKKKILKYSIEGDFLEIFNSIREACDSVGLKSHSGIVNCCTMKSSCRSTKGFQWRYYEDNYPLKIDGVPNRGVVFKERYGIGTEGAKEVNEKRKTTSLEKYGVHSPMLDPEVMKKYRNTNIQKYGVDNPAKNSSIKEKISKTERNRKTENYLSTILSDSLFSIGISKDDILNIRDIRCGHSFDINRQLLTVRSRNSHQICTVCNPIDRNQTSELEKSLKCKLDSMGIECQSNVKGLVEGRSEADIYIESHSIAIEINGSKFHSEEYSKGKTYHLRKTQLFSDKGIRLFHFFDDEIITKEPIVLSMIQNSIGKSHKIYARKCEIKEIPNSEGIKFFSKNHIQGGINAQYTYGLFYEGTLVSCMSFGKTRRMLGFVKEEESHYELLRFSNSLNLSVVGGASKLLTYFIRSVCPQKITTYANRRWSNGNLYEKIGFEFVSFTEPGYYFFHKNRRISRHALTRKSLIKMGQDPTKTTEEMLGDENAYRIWDCGNYKFEMNITNHGTI